jgi:dTDP-4-amino-4,6-dideoxygalactose transaminase
MLDLKLEYEYMKEDIDIAIRKCLDHQKWILGPEVKELEEKIAGYIDVKHCIGVSSGTDALVLSLRALSIKIKEEEYFERTDEIITTPFTFTATGDAILRAGATPVFIDIDPETYNINPKKLKKYIMSRRTGKKGILNSQSRIVGILPVHLYGQPCSMDEIMEIAGEYNLFVVEDVAQAFGGLWKGKKLGSIGNAGALSFFPSKNLGGFGDGGMVATNEDNIAELARMLLRHGGKDKFNVEHIGYNARLDTLQAAIILAKFKYIDELNRKRKKIADIYNKELAGIKGIICPKYSLSNMSSSTFCHVYHQYSIRVLNGERNALKEYLRERGISTMVYYPLPLHKMKVFDGKSKIFDDLKESEKASSEVLSLPIEPVVRTDNIFLIAKSIREFFHT